MAGGYSIFCGSLFKPGQAIETVDLIQMDTLITESHPKSDGVEH